MNLTNLDTFVRVAELGSLSAAAVALDVPKSTVSRRVARLERDLGLSLFQRAGRRYTLTDRGRLLRDRCAPALREIADVQRALNDMDPNPSGVLRLTCPYDVGTAPGFGTLLAGFRELFPQVRLRVDLSNRVVDLIEERFDIALRTTSQVTAPGLMARALGGIEMGLYASEAYLQRRGRPTHVSQLAEHDTIGHTVVRTIQVQGVELPDLTEGAAIVGGDFGLVFNCAVNGAGVGVLPSFLARPAVEEGALTLLFPLGGEATARFWLTWPETRQLSPKVRAFVDYASEAVPRLLC